MSLAASSRPRVSVGGKFFRLGQAKFHVRGLTYGPFEPGPSGFTFASQSQTARDFDQIQRLNVNVVRVYHVPPSWCLDLALERQLRLFVDIPWSKHVCFLDSTARKEQARQAVRQAVSECGGHPGVFALSVANEIPSDIVRWSGARAVADFIDELIQIGKAADPDGIYTFTNYPPTEFLQPQCLDFVSFNVYLHQRAALANYLARLQMMSDARPLVLSEIGIDSIREGEPRKSEMLRWQIEESFRSGLAGAVVFSFTDDWWFDGRPVDNWGMGVTTTDRTPKASAAALAEAFRIAPYFPMPRHPKVSVVVCGYNADRTLEACLESLQRLNYPDYEVILVDDGSTDTTRQIAEKEPLVRYLRHDRNRGLSAARNTGLAAALGEIVAYTDADCRADEDWLYYLVSDLLNGEFAGMGGPNLLPPEDLAVAAAVMASPGGPAHVMLTDRQAEHIPGCNMAFFKVVLEEIGGFDPIFHAAGDDVDVCWRLQQAGYKIGFSPAAFVWHYRRSTIGEYLKQQHGYGEAEALLVRKHPEYFNSLGGSVWRGKIYSTSGIAVRLRPPIIYRGRFGSAGFQAMYSAEPTLTLLLCTSLEYHVLVSLPLWVVASLFHYLLPLAITSTALSLAVCATAASQAVVPRAKSRAWSRPLIALLFFLQPIVRGWARYQGRLLPSSERLTSRQTLDSVALRDSRERLDKVDYWSTRPLDRLEFVRRLLEHLERQAWLLTPDIGWSDHDVEIYGGRWNQLQLATVVEDLARKTHLLRCRLRVRWSLQSKVLFWTLVGCELPLLGYFGPKVRSAYFALLLIPILFWFLRRQGRNLQSMIVVSLDQLAKELGLVRLPEESAKKSSPGSPASGPATPQTTADESKQTSHSLPPT